MIQKILLHRLLHKHFKIFSKIINFNQPQLHQIVSKYIIIFQKLIFFSSIICTFFHICLEKMKMNDFENIDNIHLKDLREIKSSLNKNS